jgi:hypothetical protein
MATTTSSSTSPPLTSTSEVLQFTSRAAHGGRTGVEEVESEGANVAPMDRRARRRGDSLNVGIEEETVEGNGWRK